MLKSSGKIFHTYSWREKVQQYINITQKWKRNETDGSRTFDCHSQIWRILYGNRKKIIGYNASPFFLNVQGKMQGAWQSPKMLPIMVHGQAFCIMKWQSVILPQEGNPLRSDTCKHIRHICKLSPGNCHQYSVIYTLGVKTNKKWGM